MRPRFGIVSEADNAKGLVRVKFDDSDGIVSGWIPVIVSFALGAQHSFPVKVNQHVACFMDENAEHGVCIGAIYDAKNVPAEGSDTKYTMNFGDGTIVQYDADGKKLKVSAPNEVEVIAANLVYLKSNGTMKLECTEVRVIGNLKVTGDLDIDGTSHSQGDFNTEGEVTAKAGPASVSLSTHIHPVSGSNTTAPTPGT